MNFKTHNGTMTIRSLASGDHRTISCRNMTFKDGSKHRVVALLTGPDSWQGFAFATADGIRLWAKHRGCAIFEFLAARAEDGESREGKWEVMLAGTCRRCGRELTTPESIESGIGPVCAGKED